MSTLSELLAEHTQLPTDAVEHLQRVVAEWPLLADMSFADFLLWVPLGMPEEPKPAGDGSPARTPPGASPVPADPRTAAEWRTVGFKIARRNGLAAGGEMFSWILSSAAPGQARAVARQLPPPARVLYKAVWKPRFEKTKRW